MNKRDAGSLQSYFAEISRIPLLSHHDEIALTKSLDACRMRLFRGIVATGHGLQAIVTLLHSVCRGTQRVDHVVELASQRRDEKHRTVERLRSNVGVLEQLLAENRIDFVLTQDKDESVYLRRFASRRLIARYAEAARLLKGVTIRRQHLLPILQEVRQVSQRLDSLSAELSKAKASPQARGRVNELQREFSQLMQTATDTPSSLRRRLRRIARTQQEYEAARSDLSAANLRLTVSVAICKGWIIASVRSSTSAMGSSGAASIPSRNSARCLASARSECARSRLRRWTN